MGHIQRRDKNRWRARYIAPDGRERSKTFRRKVDAERFLATVEVDKLRGAWVDPRLGRTTFRQWADEFERSRVNLQETTRAQHITALNARLLPRFGDRPLAAITEMDIQAFALELVEHGLAPSTVTKYLGVLSQILRAAVRNRLIAFNPCEGVQGPGDAPLRETVFLTAEQLNALVAAMEPRHAAMVLLAGYRGLRFGEAAGLRLARLDLTLARLEVMEALKEVGGKLYFGPPKHGRIRAVSLPPFLVEILGEHIETFLPSNGGLLFTNRDGSMLRRSNFERRIWTPAVERAGLDERLTFHGLRHTAVSLLIAEGASIVELAAVMGWSRSTSAQMAVRYGHLFRARDEHLTKALERLYRNSERPGDGLGGSNEEAKGPDNGSGEYNDDGSGA